MFRSDASREAFHFKRVIAPIGAYTRPLSIYHFEIVDRDAVVPQSRRSYGSRSHDETLNTRLCGSIIILPKCGIRKVRMRAVYGPPMIRSSVFHRAHTHIGSHMQDALSDK